MQFLFTIFERCSENVRLSFDFETGDVVFTNSRQVPAYTKTLDCNLYSLFSWKKKRKIQEMVYSGMNFHEDRFKELVVELSESVDGKGVYLDNRDKLLVFLEVRNYGTSSRLDHEIGGKKLTDPEIRNVLLGKLNNAQFQLFTERIARFEKMSL